MWYRAAGAGAQVLGASAYSGLVAGSRSHSRAAGLAPRVLSAPDARGRAAAQIFPGTGTPWRQLSTDVNTNSAEDVKPERVLIIGGGMMGSATAYWLKLRAGNKVNVTVLEKDPMYAHSSTAISVGELCQQFSLEENIHMSLYGAEFLRNADKYLAVDGSPPPEVKLSQNGYLVLAKESGAANLEENSRFQNSLGACNELLSPTQLKAKFPWLNTDDIAVGCLGLQNEGWFDPWLLLEAFRRKAQSLGANYVTGEVIDITTSNTKKDSETAAFCKVESVLVKSTAFEETQMTLDRVLITAGAQSGHVSRLAGIGVGEDDLAVPLPVEPRKRVIYYVRCPSGPAKDTPLIIDPSGTYFRSYGERGDYICGHDVLDDPNPQTDNFQQDHSYFRKKLWPKLSARVPAFQQLKIKSSWAGLFEYNTTDQNAVIGRHPSFHNLYLATGFNGRGIQHGPAVGRAMMELLLDDCYHTIDLSRFSFDRLLKQEELRERPIM